MSHSLTKRWLMGIDRFFCFSTNIHSLMKSVGFNSLLAWKFTDDLCVTSHQHNTLIIERRYLEPVDGGNWRLLVVKAACAASLLADGGGWKKRSWRFSAVGVMSRPGSLDWNVWFYWRFNNIISAISFERVILSKFQAQCNIHDLNMYLTMLIGLAQLYTLCHNTSAT